MKNIFENPIFLAGGFNRLWNFYLCLKAGVANLKSRPFFGKQVYWDPPSIINKFLKSLVVESQRALRRAFKRL